MSSEKGFFGHHNEQHEFNNAPPPNYAATTMPSSGFRIALNSSVAISKHDIERAGHAPFADLDRSPIYLGSAIFMHDDGVTQKSVQPCKIGPHLYPSPCSVAFGAREVSHHGRYDLLLFDPAMMEWVPTSHGRIPEGRTPIEGGYEENIRDKLYHAAARVNNILVPGKTGHHLGAAHVSFGGGEHAVREHYEILCWKLHHQ
ncbi:hypothetical protein B0H16DRAFT_1511575 [Mycena metata]|uniref:Uncharacterized protein n=1 Tax=Mycena metata TaxID=1033252 RepID=A0AAD7NSW0_9AGAR|nr:hypothetical protein B0H16DRAFT_1511575 [Mycena metata]